MTSLNPPMTRRSTPPVALGASKPTVALTPSKASYTANLSLLCPPASSFLRLLRFTMSTPRTPMSTPRFVLSYLTSPCHPSSCLRTQDPLYSSPFSIASSEPLCLRPRFYCATKTLMSTPKIDIYAGVYYVYNQDLISTVARLLGQFDTVGRPFGGIRYSSAPF